MPSYIALPANPSDIPAIAALIFAANVSDPVFSAISPKGATSALIDHTVNQLERTMDEDMSVYMMVVKEAMYGEVVGYANWHFMLHGHGLDAEITDPGAEVFGSDEVNSELGTRCLRRSIEKRAEIVKEVLAGSEATGSGYAYISSIGVHPSHQRHGAGSKLVEWGIERADDKGLPIYVESTPAALSLYHKYGFRQYDQLLVDLKPWNHEVVEHTCMIRLPNAT